MRFDNTYQIGTRLMGVIQAGLGAGEVIAGTGLSAAGVVGCLQSGGLTCLAIPVGGAVAMAGADHVRSGTGTAIAGQPQRTLGSLLVQEVTGLSPHASEIVYGLATGGAGVGASKALTHQAGKMPTQTGAKEIAKDSIKPVVTSQGTANAATVSKLTEQLTSESLIASGTNIKNIKVIAKGRIEGRVYIDTNQAARGQQAANSAEKTLVPTERIFDTNRFSMHENVNGNMATAHAEIGVIQQASNAGVAKGADMTLSVQAKAVCQFCRGDIPAAAQNAGLKSLTIIDKTAGVTWYWNPGMRNLKVKK